MMFDLKSNVHCHLVAHNLIVLDISSPVSDLKSANATQRQRRFRQTLLHCIIKIFFRKKLQSRLL
nr:hypothetical protein [Fischerella muscicola]